MRIGRVVLDRRPRKLCSVVRKDAIDGWLREHVVIWQAPRLHDTYVERRAAADAIARGGLHR